jgi:H+-translocating NAD(P) transhydrogenase subunit beta
MSSLSPALINLFYLISVSLFIVGLQRLSSPKTASSGNLIAAMGMGIGILIALLMPISSGDNNYGVIAIALFFGAAIGYVIAGRVLMTQMPEMVSLFNGLGGACALFISIAELLNFHEYNSIDPATYLTTLLALLIGSVAFTGSLVAYGKLAGSVKDSWKLPKANIFNMALLLALISAVIYQTQYPTSIELVYIIMLFALTYGVTFVLNVGGADMPVIISILNALTGVSAALAGVMYDNKIMLLAGILVGSSGAILTLLMCRAMNRSLISVLAGGFGGTSVSAVQVGDKMVKEVSVMDASIMLRYSQNVVIVPGYGMAVAQAQKICKELEDQLEQVAVNVRYAIHPVAGRMPGHMNVLLAEANVDYSKLLDLEEANKFLKDTDVTIVVGANDVVNPSALDDPGSPIYGMPILEILQGKNVIVLKRGMSSGYSGIENPLFFNEKTKMLFGDAKNSLISLLEELKVISD